jgi:hypothetical protein
MEDWKIDKDGKLTKKSLWKAFLIRAKIIIAGLFLMTLGVYMWCYHTTAVELKAVKYELKRQKYIDSCLTVGLTQKK